VAVSGTAARQLDGLQDEEQEAQEGPRGQIREDVGEQLAGAWCGGGSLMTAIRKPAAVKASVIACSGRCQKLMPGRTLVIGMLH
jgi:hypothetical protein